MSVVWSGVTQSGAVVPVQVDSLGRVIATTGEPPGPPVIEYNGASSWANFDGTLPNGKIEPRGSLNVQRITKVNPGRYDVQFQNPMGSADYSVVTGYTGYAELLTPGGFILSVYSAVDGEKADFPDVFFAVHSINSLPPKGGTGLDAWASVDATGANPAIIDASFNITSITTTGNGQYDVLFTVPMPTAKYAVTTSLSENTFGLNVLAYNKSTTGFSIAIRGTSGGSYQGYSFDFQVACSNATLPLTVTAEQIDAVINNWQKTADTLSTKDAVEMNGPVRFAGGKAGVTSMGEFYFTPGPGPEKYLLSVEEGQMQLKRIDSVY